MKKLVFLILVILILTGCNFLGDTPMSESQVERFYYNSYQYLEIVATFLSEIDYNGETEARKNENGDNILYQLYGNIWREKKIIRDETVNNAINNLQTEWYHRIYRWQNKVKFIRDTRGEWSRDGRFRTAVVYIIDGTQPKIYDALAQTYTPLSRENWFIYIYCDRCNRAS